jgi:adenosine deaminase CECR1
VAWLSSVRLDKAGEGRKEFFEMTWPRLGELIRDSTITLELLVENMQRFGAEGVRYIEGMSGVAGMQDHQGNLIPAEDMVARYRKRLSQPDAVATGVAVRFLLSVLRYGPDAPQRIEQNYALIDKHRDLFVGVNIVGEEDDDRGYPLRFLNTFRKLRRTYSNIGVTLHAGEGVSPNNNHHVKESLLLGATRIGHGVNLITDPGTLLLMRHNRYLIEVCLVSNHLVEYTSDPSSHPFPEYLRLGIPVSLNTDDRGMWDSNMTDEYYMAATLFNVTWPELMQIGRNSLEFSFAEPALKQRLIREFDRDAAAFERKYTTQNWRTRIKEVKAVASGYAGRNFGVRFY